MLELNFSKTKCILFSTLQSNVQFPTNSLIFENSVLHDDITTTLLGVKVNKTLSRNDQIDKVCTSLGFVNSILFRLKMQSIPTNVLLITYKTLFLPYINYACCIWGMTTKANLDRIQRLQNSALRIIYGFSRSEHVTPYRTKYSLFNVRQIIHRFTCNFIHKELKLGSERSYFQQYFYYSAFSQDQQRLFLPCARLSCRQRTIFFQGIQMYNKLPTTFRGESYGIFKKLVKTFSVTLDQVMI